MYLSLYIYIYIYTYIYIYIYIYIYAGARRGRVPLAAGRLRRVGESCDTQYHVQVVVAGVVVIKALFWTDIVTVFGLLATDFGPTLL